ncbi:MAG: hypothetical protein SOV25_00975 [Candidatus Onthovivens sp.]|nr:hypothetical protein [Candidatus Onthovivens sp.]
MTNSIKENLNTLELSDVYSLMLFVLYKVQDIPEYAVLSELCYLMDSRSLTRLFTYFAGKTITIPTESEFKILANALLMYQKVNIDRKSYSDAIAELKDLTPKEKTSITNLYLQIIDIMNNYNINRNKVKRDAR